jgi:D-alanine-D-alanine ligase
MILFKDKIIGVLMGGLSKEREISLQSGNAVLDALLTHGYDAVPVDVGKDLTTQLKEKGVEVAFLALHGRYGEDGCVQGLLEILGLPYTGSSVLASALAMDKFLTKEVVRGLGILVPRDFFVDGGRQDLSQTMAEVDLEFPVVVKPCREGSTIGISVVKDRQELESAVQDAAALDSRVLIEEFVAGRELTVGVINQEALPVLEVVTPKGFYDYEAKYQSNDTQYFCPADIPEAIAKKLQSQSVALCDRIGCEGVARADFILNQAGEAYFLEVNTLPGMTSHSLVPKAAQAAGLSFSDLVEKILSTARVKIQ